MKLGKILIAGASLIAFAAPATAQMTFNWSFDNSWYGVSDQFVTGTISGLSEGVNSAHGLSITITSTPNGEALGPADLFGSGTFTVTDGEVTYANAVFGSDAGFSLYFGTQPGNGTYFPEYQHYGYGGAGDVDVIWDFTSTNPTQFSLAETPSPTPEPASWAMMVGGFSLAGAAMRRRRKVALSFG
jgi:hypothetical protein